MIDVFKKNVYIILYLATLAIKELRWDKPILLLQRVQLTA